MTVLRSTSKGRKVGSGPFPGNLHPFAQIAEILLPLIQFQFQLKFSCSVVSDSLWSHGLQHARLLCPSQCPGVWSSSCPLSRWCLPTISTSVIPFSFRLQSFPASGSFSNESALRIRWPKYWSFSFNISPSNECFGLTSFKNGWFNLLAVQGTLKSLLQHHNL